jgi:hypothetical protein
MSNFLRGALGAFLILNSPFGASYASSPSGNAGSDLALKIYRDLLQNNKVKNTGLFLSFPETRDRKLSQQSSTYDQAALGLLALQLGDDETVETLLKFFDEQWDLAAAGPGGGGLANFYNAYFGTVGIENTVHAGPNAWIGLFGARAARLAHSKIGGELALKIARWMRTELPHQEGAVAMSARAQFRGVPWPSVFSTENNLSYYAFLSEILKLPLPDEERSAFIREQRNVENWLIHTAYRPQTHTVLRGINPQGLDPTPALDVYTWLLLAMGPRKLHEIGVEPRPLFQKAAQFFEVRIGDQTGVDAVSAGRRTIWYEGLGHYILCLDKLAQFSGHNEAFQKKMGEMTRSFDRGSLSPGRIPPRCPYSTPGDDLSPALISSVWRAYVAMKYNPLRDNAAQRSPNRSLPLISLWQTLGIEGDRREMIRYGTSEEMMSQVWAAVQERREDSALREASALIQEWSPLAHEQQRLKKERIGGLVAYNGNPKHKNEIFSYAALNDVSAACWIIGKILHEQGKEYEAKAAFTQIFEHYSLGQVWDPQGWFWSPAQAAFKEYIEVYPKIFGLATRAMAAEIPDEVSSVN